MAQEIALGVPQRRRGRAQNSGLAAVGRGIPPEIGGTPSDAACRLRDAGAEIYFLIFGG